MAMQKTPFDAKIEVLLGERGGREQHAVRHKDLASLKDQIVTQLTDSILKSVRAEIASATDRALAAARAAQDAADLAAETLSAAGGMDPDTFSEDVEQALINETSLIAANAGVTTVTSLPASGRPDQVVLLVPPGRFYRWDAPTGLWTQDLLTSDRVNLYPDFDMLDAGFYSGSSGAVFSFIRTSANELGARYLQIEPDAAQKIVYTTWFPIEAAGSYNVSGGAWLASAAAGSGTAQVALQFGSVDASGNVTVTRQTNVSTRTDTLTYLPETSEKVVNADEKVARFALIRNAGGTAAARFGGLRLTRMVARAAIQDGAVTDFADVYNPGPFSAADVLTNRATLDLGVIAPKTFQRRGVEFEARSPSYFTTGGGTVDNNMLRGLFQRRLTDPGGVMSAWETLETFNVRSAAWGYYRDSGTSVGSYDDFEYRLAFEVVINGGTPGIYAATNVIRNLRVFSEAASRK